MKQSSQRGVALVTTLIMLAVVTLMAVTFLAVTRRERSSVRGTRDATAAKYFADTALARAQSEVVADMLVRTNLLRYDLRVSTNFINPFGFRSGIANVSNVNYSVHAGGGSFSANDQLQNLANLQIDPRPPVYYTTNKSGAQDFRFFLDFNRNGRYESSGYVRPFNRQGLAIPGLTNYVVGDPEWIGVLEHPDRPHSASNLFIGRYCYLTLPAGKTLDLNFMHNQARLPSPDQEGFLRDQGVGPWELNLAAFLRDLNTNSWPSYSYAPLAASSGNSIATQDALTLLRYRYDLSYKNLKSAGQLLNPNYWNTGPGALDGVNRYAGLPIMTNINPDRANQKLQAPAITTSWSGSDTANAFYDVLDFYRTPANNDPGFQAGFQNFKTRLQSAATNNSTYDRYSLYTLLSQMGTESAPANAGKLNLNFDNVSLLNGALLNATNMAPWAPLGFFTNAAERMLRAQFNFGATNIMLWPTNEYTQDVHRLLQLTANVYDYSTNDFSKAAVGPAPPSVFRPILKSTGTNVFVGAYLEVLNANVLTGLTWLDLNSATDRAKLSSQASQNFQYAALGVPFVVGAKKGYPNFNEFEVQTTVLVTRRLKLAKKNPLTDKLPNLTNQMYMLGVSNRFGIEAWNSYSNSFPRGVELRVQATSTSALRNATNRNILYWPKASPLVTQTTVTTNVNGGDWRGASFQVPLNTNILFLANSIWRPGNPSVLFDPSTNSITFDSTPGFPIPSWLLTVTNRVRYTLVDKATQRVLDFVNLDNLVTEIDISKELLGSGGDPEAVFWSPQRKGNNATAPPQGVLAQINESLGVTSLLDWKNYNATLQDKQKSIDGFRVYLGLAPLYFPTNHYDTTQPKEAIAPTRRFFQSTSWQVNDPLVHYTAQDLTDLGRPTNRVEIFKPPQQTSTNSNLGLVNARYSPWGGATNKSHDLQAFNLAIKDPMIGKSDDWNFPTNQITKFANVGWLGRVHRGTPWQTVYLKSAVVDNNTWSHWAGSFPNAAGQYPTHPTNDWRLLDLFTTAPNDNAARGLLSVNQTNAAAWSAVLSGVAVLSNEVNNAKLTLLHPRFIEPASLQLSNLVDGPNGINATRRRFPEQQFSKMGDILATPALTVRSPFLQSAYNDQATDHSADGSRVTGPPDEVYERIPQQILSLLKADEPRVVVYAFGQSLAPAPRSRVLAPGPFNQMVTNYQVTAEAVTKSVIRFEDLSTKPTVLQPRAVTESFQLLPAE